MTNKLDGERCLLYGTRNGSVICKSPFKSNTLVPSSSKFDGLTILDGEWLEKTQTVWVFDCLYYKGLPRYNNDGFEKRLKRY